MSRRWRIALALVALLVAVNLVLRFLGTLTGGTPGGPRSSSYATVAARRAAYAELLGRRRASDRPGAEVAAPGAARRGHDGLPARPAVGRDAGSRGAPAIRPRAVAVSSPPACRLDAMHQLVANVPTARARSALSSARTGSRSRPAVRRSGETRTSSPCGGSGAAPSCSWPTPRRSRTGSSVPPTTRRSGSRSPARASRPVEFLESYHGYGTGERAVGAAALLEAAARRPRSRGARLHGRARPALRPARAGRPESPAAAARVRRLARRGGRAQQAARRGGRARAPRGPRRGPRGVPRCRRARRTTVSALAAKRLGLTDDDAEALLRPADTDADVVALGRAAARIRQDQR